MTTVVIADDVAMLRSVVRLVLEEHGFSVVGEAQSGPEAVELALVHRPDLCVLDVQMPEGDGLTALVAITDALPETRCVMLSASGSDDHLLTALRGGAVGFLSKGTDLDRLAQTLKGVLRGEAALPRHRVMRLIDELRSAPLPVREGRHLVDVSADELACLHRRRAGTPPPRRWSRRG
jgi:DNA-binding NarL/FixJ family response regulator